MKKKKSKDIKFVIGIAVIVTIVGVLGTNAIMGRTIQIMIGDDEVLVDVEGEETFGGMVFIAQRDFPDGISVDGTEVIDGDGLWRGRILGTTTPSNIPTFGTSALQGCIIMGGTTAGTAALYYLTVESGVMTVTGGASNVFSVPTRCTID